MFSRIFSLFVIPLLAFGLSGCSPAGDDSFANGTSANSDTESDAGAEANAYKDAETDAEGYAEIITASYELFMSQGMTEEVFSAGDNYILTATSSDEFRAGLFNESFDDTLELSKDDLVLFTVYSAKIMIDDDQTVITELENSVSLANENYGDFTVFFENGLITSAKSNDDSWSGEFSYQPDLVTLAKLDQEN